MLLNIHQIYYAHALRGVNVECRCCYLSIGQIGHFLPEPIVRKDFHVKTGALEGIQQLLTTALHIGLSHGHFHLVYF
jgi:hypothetical protein